MAERMRVKTGRARPVVQLSVPMLVGLVMTSVDSAPPQAGPASQTPSAIPDSRPNYKIQPIGCIRKVDGRTTIELYDEYRPALLGVDALDSIWVFYWFDRNDTPAQRAILQVHPRGNPDNPLRGVFATRAPVRPNLIALSRCRVLSVEGSTIVIEGIDAFADTPVLDIKP
jgi:tRNA (adenine37-N6)-methyltransferase